jgi:predicted CXXCH cytochrome family protein
MVISTWPEKNLTAGNATLVLASKSRLVMKRRRLTAPLTDANEKGVSMIKKTILLSIAMILFAIHDVPEAQGAHVFKKNHCRRCHQSLVTEPSRLVNKSLKSICGSCHRRLVKRSSHPVDFIPRSMEVPQDMPLTRGKLTCNTCHDIHSDEKPSSGPGKYYLRGGRSAGQDFCISCHVRDTEQEMHEKGHVFAMGVAHVGYYYANRKDSKNVDPLSLACMGCHDSSMAAHVLYNSDISGAGEHPIGIDYKKAMMENEKLRHPSEMDRSIKFFRKRIGCGTCHDFYSTEKSMLVRSNRNSSLCINCHIV